MLAAWLFVTLAAALAAWLVLSAAGTAADAAAWRRAAIGAAGAEQSVARLFDTVRALHEVASARARFLTTGDLAGVSASESWIGRLDTDNGAVREVAVLAADGSLAYSSVPGWQPANFAERSFFRAHALEGVQGMYATRQEPGLAADREGVHVSRPLRDPDGALIGIAVVSIDPALLAASLAPLVRDPADEICILRRRTGDVLAGTPPGSRGEQRSACGDPRLFAAVASGDAEGMLALPAEGGQPGRLVVHRRVGQGGMSAAYVIDGAAMAAAFRPFRWMVYAVTGGMLLLVLVLALTILAVLRRRSRLVALRLLNETVENLPVAVYRARLDPSGGWALRYASPALSTITGEPAARGGTPADWRALVDPVSRPVLARFTDTLRAEGSATVEVRLLRPDGTWRLVRDRARILRRAKDGGSEVSGYLADVTEMRETERRAIETAKLATLGGLAAGLAHELNQPLTAVLLAAENAQHAIETGDTPGALRRIERIIGEIERTKSITGHLQRIARAQGREPLRAVDLAEAWRGALLMTGASLRQDSIQVTPALPAGLPAVTARPVQLEQVFVNLLLNARDALASRPPGQRYIRAEASLRGGDVVLRIRDTGAGIPPDILPRLFEPFVTTRPAAAATGLGLSICRALVEEFGGAITARNGAEGAEFTLRLPLAAQPAEGSHPA